MVFWRKKKIGKHYKHPNHVGKQNIEALMSQEAYKNRGLRKNIGKYHYMGQYSSPERAVYSDSKTGALKVAIRGTANLKDVRDDLGIAFGGLKKTKRFKRETKALENLKKTGKDVSLVGHSLGGRLSSDLAKKYNLKATTFNEGRGLPDLLKKDNNQNITRFRTNKDIVSLAGVLGGTKFNTLDTNQNPLSAHGISNFTSYNLN